MKEFGSAYAATTGCSPDANIFLARNWEFIRPGVAPAESPPDAESDDTKTSKKGKSR